MTTATARFTLSRIRCHWRPIIMVGAAVVLLCVFWFASRYPQLLSKAEHVGQAVPSMAYSSQVMHGRGGCPRVAANPGRHRQLARQHEDRHDLRRAVRRAAAYGPALLSAQDRQESVPELA